MPDGSVKFVADTSQFNAPLKEATQSVLGVASASEEARTRIVSSYQSQIRAAKEAGASQRELAAITRQVTSLTANLNEDNAKRFINSIDRMEDRTRRFNAARTTISGVSISDPISQFSFGGLAGPTKEAEELGQAVEGVGKAAGYAVAPSVRFGSVLRAMEGGFTRNIRSAEYFGASLSFLEPLMATAFPIVGAVTLGYALVEMGKHAYEAFENIVQLKGAIEGLNKLQINVASTVDKNNDSAENSVESILELTQGKTAALKQKYSYQSQKPVDLSSYFYSKEFSGLTTNVKANYETLYKSVAPADVPAKLKSIREEITNVQAALDHSKDHNSGGFEILVGGYGPSSTQNPTKYYEARLEAAKQIQEQLESGSTSKSASLQQIQLDIPKAQKDEQKKASQEALAAQREATAAKKQADTLAIQQQNADHLEWAAAQARSKLDEVLYWSSFVAITDDGSARALDARKKYQQASVALNREQSETMKRAISEFSKDYNRDFYERSGLSNRDTGKLNSAGHDSLTFITALRDKIDLQRQDSDSLAENAIQMGVATGQMSKLSAARATAALHQKQYKDSLDDLTEDRKTITKDPLLSDVGRTAALQDNTNQTNSLNDNYSIQQRRDQQAINPAATSMSVGFSDAINDFINASRNGAEQMRDLTNNTLHGLNQQIIGAISGQKTNFGNFGASVFRGVAGVGLQKAEGSLLGIFGGGSPGTSSSNALWVRSADKVSSGVSAAISGIGKAGSGVSGFFGGLLKSMLPGFANGTDYMTGPAIVGEKGPELFWPSSGGSITPNNKLASLGGGGHTFNIDARGSNDPAQTEAAVNRALERHIPNIVGASVRAVHENNMRTPSSIRRN